MKPGCTLIAYLHAKPEKREELLKILHSLVKPSRAEPANCNHFLICCRSYNSFWAASMESNAKNRFQWCRSTQDHDS
jgi:hypothetical protein